MLSKKDNYKIQNKKIGEAKFQNLKYMLEYMKKMFIFLLQELKHKTTKVYYNNV